MMVQPPLLRAGSMISAVILFVLGAGLVPGHAGDAASGRKIAAVKCQMCHGMDGRAKLPQAPHLSGQVEAYIVAQMEAYRNGARKNDMMSLVVPTLSENDVADLAAFYSMIEVKIVKVPGE